MGLARQKGDGESSMTSEEPPSPQRPFHCGKFLRLKVCIANAMPTRRQSAATLGASPDDKEGADTWHSFLPMGREKVLLSYFLHKYLPPTSNFIFIRPRKRWSSVEGIIAPGLPELGTLGPNRNYVANSNISAERVDRCLRQPCMRAM